MKNKPVFLVVGFLAVAGSASLNLLSKPSYVPTRGYSTSSLPTTINLNDCDSDTIRNYYSSLNSLPNEEKTSSNLLKNLKPILKNNQKYYSYDSTQATWQIYEITDRDWEKSPASSTTYGTYDAVNNRLVDYVYGTSNSNGKNNPYVHALYINRNVENQTKAWGNHNQDEWGINREHVWPKSEGFEVESSAGGARGDPMHLIAGNGYSNKIHSNYFFGYVDKTKTYTDCGATYSNQSGNLKGISKTTGSGTVFEPQDSDKGDIARALFYMAARYNYLSGSDPDGINSDNPNLEITQSVSHWSSTGFSSSTTRKGYMGVLTDLLEWNRLDPVDEYEIHRNNLLFNNFTNNRNPFIDFPEWADLIWGENQYTKYANPLLDRINGSGLSVSTSSINIEPNKTTTVTASTSDNSNIAWTVADNTIVSVSKTESTSGEEITVTALKEGETKITVTANVEGEDVSFEIKVVVAKKDFVFGLPVPYIIAIGVVLGVVIIVGLIFYFSRTSKAKRRINKKVKKTVKDSIEAYNKANAPKKRKK